MAPSVKTPVYLDYNASTPVDLVEAARRQVAEMYAPRGNHIVTCQSEHKAVLGPVRWLESRGLKATRLSPDRYGRVSAEQIDEAVDEQTILISIMAANNVVGTLNVLGIVGMGLACEIVKNQLDEDARRMRGFRDRLFAGLSQRIPNVILNGHPEQRLPNTLNIVFDGVNAGELMQSLPEIAASTGSACMSGTDDPNYVLHAMGCDAERADASIRFSMGRFTTGEEIDYCMEKVVAAVKKLSCCNGLPFVSMEEMLNKDYS